MTLFGFGKKKRRRRRKKKTERKSIGVMNIILIIIGVSMLAFTIAMIELFKIYGAVPDTLVTCVFAALGGECGIMGWIKTTKERRQDRQWQQEDKQQAQKAAQTPAQPETTADQPRNNL